MSRSSCSVQLCNSLQMDRKADLACAAGGSDAGADGGWVGGLGWRGGVCGLGCGAWRHWAVGWLGCGGVGGWCGVIWGCRGVWGRWRVGWHGCEVDGHCASQDWWRHIQVVGCTGKELSVLRDYPSVMYQSVSRVSKCEQGLEGSYNTALSKTRLYQVKEPAQLCIFLVT